MKPRYFTPLLGFIVPSLVIGFGVVIPGSCIAGINNLSVGFATSLFGAAAAYWLGIRAVLADREPSGSEPARSEAGNA
jgi:ABC-type Fe3+ transport system permease subunit